MREISESFKSRIYYGARDGFSITLFELLRERSAEEVDGILNQPLRVDNGQSCTPLIVAARAGHDRVVKMIISKFKPNLEVEGAVKFDDFIVHGVTALWCAASAGHLNVVKTLVNAGANVNHKTKTLSTPLRGACYDGRLDIVKYLMDHSADINVANQYNNTCLMISSYKGHLEIVKFLLEMGADPNVKALCGATALHFAAECGHLDVVRELYKYDVKLTRNENNMTALLCSAERTRSDVVEYLIENAGVSKEDTIEALELLGASFANDKDNYSLEKAFMYLRRGMVFRYSNPKKVIKKVLVPPVPAYENWIERQSLPELDAIRNNQNALHMEALTIRERILGPQNPEVPHPVIFRGAIFADLARFDRSIELWLHALNLRKNNNVSISKDLLRFAQIFSQMLHVGLEISFSYVSQVLAAAVHGLGEIQNKITNPGPKDDPEFLSDELENSLTTTLYILTLSTKLFKKWSETEVFDVCKLVFALNRLKLTLRDGQTLLHLAVNAETPVDDFHTNDVCKFPCADTAKLLIQCGADVNAMDVKRNTPLHVIVSYQKPLSDFSTLHSIIMLLTEAGAHMDCVNGRGDTPIDSSTTGVAEIILKTQFRLNLCCMAARVIKKHSLSYKGHVPPSVESFIELHGPGGGGKLI